MIHVQLKLNEREARILNIVKAKYGFRNKNEAISFVLNRFEQEHMDSKTKPEFVERDGGSPEDESKPALLNKLDRIKEQKNAKDRDFAKRYNLK